MTKINKLGKSTFVIAILSFLLVAVLAFGGTYAYFSDSTSVDGSKVTLGTLTISEEAAWAESATLKQTSAIVVPNQVIADGDVTATVKSNIDYYVRIKLETTYVLPTHDCETLGCSLSDTSLDTPIIFTMKKGTEVIIGDGAATGETATWIVGTASTSENVTTQYIYLKAVQPAGEANDLSTLDTLSVNIKAQVNPVVGNGESQHFMGATYEFSVSYEVCQADYLGAAGEGTTLADKAAAEAVWGTTGIGKAA